jgi:hypothetical protein
MIAEASRRSHKDKVDCIKTLREQLNELALDLARQGDKVLASMI